MLFRSQVSGSYRSPAAVTQTLASYLGGIRVAQGGGRAAPFAQVLAGLEHFSEPGFAQTGFAVQPGGGIDVAVTGRLALRGQVDYRWVRVGAGSGAPAATFKEWRVGIGVVLGI